MPLCSMGSRAFLSVNVLNSTFQAGRFWYILTAIRSLVFADF